MSALLLLQLELSARGPECLDDGALEPLSAILKRMASAPETPPLLREAISQAIADVAPEQQLCGEERP